MNAFHHELDMSVDPFDHQTIPMADFRLGSWQVVISRQPRAQKELVCQYDAASDQWPQIARRYALDAAYQRALQASGAPDAIGEFGSKARVLDCGIGSGVLSMAMSRLLTRSPLFCGIDISANMLTKADFEMRHADLTPHLRQADVRALPYATATFDVVMAAHVLEHLPNPQQALREMVRVLKPGGILIVCLVRRSGFGAFVQFRWRTWAVTERLGIAWLQACCLENTGVEPIRLGSWAGRSSIAFWGQKPSGPAKAGKLANTSTNQRIEE